MNKTLAEARRYTAELLEGLDGLELGAVQPFIIPPATALSAVAAELRGDNRVLLGAQNAHWEDDGAWTGEVSVPQVADAGAQIVEIGHSERRGHFGETDETARRKVAAVLRHGLTPLLCVGEPAEVKDAGGSSGFILQQAARAQEQQGRETLRYAGSPLKYSFSEVNHKKSVTVVNLQEKGRTDIKKVPLYPLRDVRTIEGTMDELIRMPYSEDYVWITVTDELVPPDAKVTLSVNFPNMMKFSIVNSRTKQDINVLATEKMENKSPLELFSDFYRLQNNDQLPSEAHRKVLEKVIRELEEVPHETH